MCHTAFFRDIVVPVLFPFLFFQSSLSFSFSAFMWILWLRCKPTLGKTIRGKKRWWVETPHVDFSRMWGFVVEWPQLAAVTSISFTLNILWSIIIVLLDLTISWRKTHRFSTNCGSTKVVQNPHDGLKMSLAVTLVMATLVALFRPYAQAQAFSMFFVVPKESMTLLCWSTSEAGGIVIVEVLLIRR